MDAQGDFMTLWAKSLRTNMLAVLVPGTKSRQSWAVGPHLLSMLCLPVSGSQWGPLT